MATFSLRAMSTRPISLDSGGHRRKFVKDDCPFHSCHLLVANYVKGLNLPMKLLCSLKGGISFWSGEAFQSDVFIFKLQSLRKGSMDLLMKPEAIFRYDCSMQLSNKRVLQISISKNNLVLGKCHIGIIPQKTLPKYQQTFRGGHVTNRSPF